ncbi:MAG: hypothetical protein JWL72_2635 [Ilumatobacteraceae bacterium]|nr:hypothetical protein [Ilumatobacteraceae bacterium]MCU1389297.1 hypothetical protein [Ilumatobacteraceae bacterium]
MTRALLVHSPLVGPSTMAFLGEALVAQGWSTTVPDLRSGVTTVDAFLELAAASSPGPGVVLVGHSRAGAFLPALAALTGAVGSVFVDAVVPNGDESTSPPIRSLGFVDRLPLTDGRLPPWHEWWPAEVIEEGIPDPAQRGAVVADIPAVPRAFYDTAVQVPQGWWSRPCAYLQLCEAYDEDADRATGWGWPMARLDGGHLDVVNTADLVAAEVVRLVARLGL